MASNREILRNMTKMIGYIDTQGNGNRIAYDDTGLRLGEYRKSSNATATVHGKIIGYGDLTAVLIWNHID